MKTPLLIILLFSSFLLRSQENVSFILQNDLLGNIIGFTYNDCIVDMNGDFLDDVVRSGGNDLYIDYQQEDGSFQQAVINYNFQNIPSWSICAGDLDANGFNDLLFGDGNAVSFVMANGDGTDYSEIAVPSFIFSQRSTMADIDNDGHLDAFVCHDIDQSHPYRNDGAGNMVEDQSLIQTANRPGNYAAIWTDYDNDGDIDLYITKCVGGSSPGDINRTNLLYRNNNDGTYSEVGEEAGINDNAQSWSTVFEDFDNDGDFDAFIVNHDLKNRFFLNNGDGTFTDIIDQTGIDANDLGAWENASGDFNNDGFIDIISELNNELYLNNGDLTFTGQSLPFTPGAIGDLNNDGFLDVLTGINLFMNEGNDNNWLKVNTVGVQSNLNGIGARVEIHGEWGIQIREVRSGQSFSPMSSLQIHFGIGSAVSIEKVVVRWPSGIVSTLNDPEINSTVTISEVECLLPPSEITALGMTSICPGETVELEAPEGYSYEWSNGETEQSIHVGLAGSYSVVLTDTAGCVSISEPITVSIIEDIAPTISLDGPDVMCEGETVTLTSSSDENPIWSNGESGQSIVVSQTGTYSVGVDAQCAVTQLQSEPVSVWVLETENPTVASITISQGDSALIEAEGLNLEWYDEQVGGTLLAQGNTFQTPPLDANKTYFVESHNLLPGDLQDGGKPDATGNGGLPSQGAYSYFDVWEKFTLLSVRVYVPNTTSAGVRTIQLVDGLGNVLNELALDLAQGEQVIDLNFEVPVGNGFSLRCPENNLFRNNGGVSYPYPIGNVGELTTSFFGDSYYYYFYDWKIQLESFDCVSDRIPVEINVTDTYEVFKQAGLDVFPNPFSDNLTVAMEYEAEWIRLIDNSGKLIIQQNTVGKTNEVLDLGGLPAGIYLIQISSKGNLYHQKLIKE